MSIESMLKEFKSIEERFITDEPTPVEKKDSEETPEDPEEKPAEKPEDKDEVFSKEIDDINGETPEAIKEALDMLLSVSLASAERVRSIINKILEDESIDLDQILTQEIIDKTSDTIEAFQDIESDIVDVFDVDNLPDEDEEEIPAEDEIPSEDPDAKPEESDEEQVARKLNKEA